MVISYTLQTNQGQLQLAFGRLGQKYRTCAMVTAARNANQRAFVFRLTVCMSCYTNQGAERPFSVNRISSLQSRILRMYEVISTVEINRMAAYKVLGHPVAYPVLVGNMQHRAPSEVVGFIGVNSCTRRTDSTPHTFASLTEQVDLEMPPMVYPIIAVSSQDDSWLYSAWQLWQWISSDIVLSNENAFR